MSRIKDCSPIVCQGSGHDVYCDQPAGLKKIKALAIKRLDDEDPLNPVITFYAELTKFRNKKIQDLLLQKLENAWFIGIL